MLNKKENGWTPHSQSAPEQRRGWLRSLQFLSKDKRIARLAEGQHLLQCMGGEGCDKVDPAFLPPPTTEKSLLEYDSRAASPLLLPPDSPGPGRSTLEERGILGLSTPKQVRRTLAQRGQSVNPQPSSLEPRHCALTVVPFCSQSRPGQALKRPAT